MNGCDDGGFCFLVSFFFLLITLFIIFLLVTSFHFYFYFFNFQGVFFLVLKIGKTKQKLSIEKKSIFEVAKLNFFWFKEFFFGLVNW